MTKGKVAAQCCHAALAAYQEAVKKCPSYIKAWEDNGQAKITLKVQNEQDLKDLYRNAKAQGLVAVIIQDAGKTQIEAGSRTVLAVGPAPKSDIDKVTGHLSLY